MRCLMRDGHECVVYDVDTGAVDELEGPPPVHPYRPGSWEPDAADEPIAPRSWRLPEGE